ncbi:hypothetical protein RJ640_016754 [Escallonia rubra]|uniref:Mechanosensitive ion channel protein n=1 Tax=Escallonia rubra TaxID=112253 RepID=A0AA88QQA2_9ASTE|nr:hypothetical protein RJ640_016754 [Escallonia rubra]
MAFFKKSFKSNGSYKIPAETHEHIPILSDPNGNSRPVRTSSLDPDDVVIKIEGEDSPPSKLIGRFAKQQEEGNGEMSFDADFEMGDFRDFHNPKDFVSKPQAPSSMNGGRDKHDNNADASIGDDEGEIQEQKDNSRFPYMSPASEGNNGSGEKSTELLLCLYAFVMVVLHILDQLFAGFRRETILSRSKTKSRLEDPVEMTDRRSGRMGISNQNKSGTLAKSGQVDEEDDFLLEEDIPDNYKNIENLNALTLIQWVSLAFIVIALVCTLSISKWMEKDLRGLEMWKWEVLVLVLICGWLVSGWGVRVVVFCIERNFVLRKKVLYFVYGVRNAVQNCIWLGLVLLAWHLMFHKEVEGSIKFLRNVDSIMLCMLVSTLLWLGKTLLVKVLASSFHVSTFFDRIQESLFNQYVIETLSGPPLIEARKNREEEAKTMAEVSNFESAGSKVSAEIKATTLEFTKSPRVRAARVTSTRNSGALTSKKQDDGIPIDHLQKLNPKNISAWNMKRWMNVVRHGVMSTLDEQILDSAHEDDSTRHIRSEFEAKVAARKIFRNVAKADSKFIYLEDLLRYLEEKEALKTMSLLEGSSECEQINKSSLKNWVVKAFSERRALALTLNDTKTAVKKLHKMVNVLVSIVAVVICLGILGVQTRKILPFITSQFLVVAFIFGNTLKTLFEAIIFLFVMHPFDVGDRCEIDGVQMIVEEMSILTTTFLRYDSQKIMFPNSTLATKPISNYNRSPDMGDSIDFFVHIATPEEKVSIIKERITSYIESKNDHWHPAPTIVVMNFVGLNILKMSLWPKHRMNHQDMGEKFARRTLLIEEIVKIFKELDFEYHLRPIDIHVRSLPPMESSQLASSWTIC